MRVPASPYSWLMLAGIAVTLLFWSRLARRDERLLIIYVAALTSAFVGAKLVYLAAEGWLFWDSPDRWLILATGKSILGALLGGYAGVELAKKLLHYRTRTGDFFAFVAPVGIVIGRIGCLLHGCCRGRICARPAWWTVQDMRGLPMWPAVQVEMAFNIAILLVFLGVKWQRTRRGTATLQGQLFHVYLIAYGLFRFAHEFMRATPRLGGGLSGYHWAALAVAALGAVGFIRRARSPVGAPSAPPAS
jgi:phosphatidylglycerol:prolipoprotein diacylglycerol transferase